jgi:hypothetical protein
VDVDSTGAEVASVAVGSTSTTTSVSVGAGADVAGGFPQPARIMTRMRIARVLKKFFLIEVFPLPLSLFKRYLSYQRHTVMK